MSELISYIYRSEAEISIATNDVRKNNVDLQRISPVRVVIPLAIIMRITPEEMRRCTVQLYLHTSSNITPLP